MTMMLVRRTISIILTKATVDAPDGVGVEALVQGLHPRQVQHLHVKTVTPV
jgi:hypothetical protein